MNTMSYITVSEPINKIFRLVLTKKCNNQCFYCHKEGMTEYTPELLTIDNYEFIIKTTSDLFDGFALVGGEPILFNDLLHIAYLINHYKGRPSHLTTNATVSLKEVKEHIHLFERINLSVNTLNPETYKTITGSEFSID